MKVTAYVRFDLDVLGVVIAGIGVVVGLLLVYIQVTTKWYQVLSSIVVGAIIVAGVWCALRKGFERFEVDWESDHADREGDSSWPTGQTEE